MAHVAALRRLASPVQRLPATRRALRAAAAPSPAAAPRSMRGCSNQVWGGGDPRDVKYERFAAHAPPFDSHDAAARVIDAMPPRLVGALLRHGLGWLHDSGALRREPDVLPLGGGVASTSAGAQTFRVAVNASVCGAPPPDTRLPWGLLACKGWYAPGSWCTAPAACLSAFRRRVDRACSGGRLRRRAADAGKCAAFG